jgi:hypothetical protein
MATFAKQHPAVFFLLVLMSLPLTPSEVHCRTLVNSGTSALTSIHDSPKKMIEGFIRTLKLHPPTDMASAFENMCSELKLKKETAGSGELAADWSSSNHSRHFFLRASHPLGVKTGMPDYDNRYLLSLFWLDPDSAAVGISDLQNQLGAPFAFDRNGDPSWLIDGALLRASGSRVSSVLYEARNYVKDPLDFVERPSLPKLPDWQNVESILKTSSLFSYWETSTEEGWKKQEFCFSKMTTSPEHISKCVTRYLSESLGNRYLVGLEVTMITPAGQLASETDYASMFSLLGVPTTAELVGGVFGAASSEGSVDPYSDLRNSIYQLGNLSVLRVQQDPKNRVDGAIFNYRIESVYVWRRIEVWPEWRKLTRPDLK